MYNIRGHEVDLGFTHIQGIRFVGMKEGDRMLATVKADDAAIQWYLDRDEGSWTPFMENMVKWLNRAIEREFPLEDVSDLERKLLEELKKIVVEGGYFKYRPE